MPTKRISIPQVAVQIPLTLKGHLDVFEGILQYMRLHGPWRLYRMEGRPGEQKLLDLKRWGCTGIITGPCTLEEARLIARTRIPVAVFEPSPEMRERSHPLANRASLIFDSYAAGVQAARFFLERHYRHFAFVGEGHGLYWSQERSQGFKETVAAAGATCAVYPRLNQDEQRDWAVEQPRMQAWLKALPKPTALFAAMDGRASQVLDACMAANVTVPEEVAVLGVDNDPHICEATFPTLSSIETNGTQNGYLLAEYLDGVMRGKHLPKQIFHVIPTRIVPRQSTDATAIPDRQISKALEFIWSEAGHRPISVPDVVKLIGSSRRFAEIHFKTAVGRTIMEEIRRVKLKRVCALLAETNLPIGEIAEMCGFTRESHLAFLFRKSFNTTMSQYRKLARNKLTN
jgi:LacI family transcriptional regulator